MASEQERADVKQARRAWIARLPRMQLEPHRLVFIDETSINTTMCRLYGRSLCGRLKASAPWIIDGPMNRAFFDAYIETKLAPTLQKGDVVILDNLAAHKSVTAARCLKERDAWFLFLPPYSPDLNPIENAFSKLKAHLRACAARTYDGLCRAVGSICDLFNETDCWACFKAMGYASD